MQQPWKRPVHGGNFIAHSSNFAVPGQAQAEIGRVSNTLALKLAEHPGEFQRLLSGLDIVIRKRHATDLDAYKLAMRPEAARSDVDMDTEAPGHVGNGCLAIVLQVVELSRRKDAPK